MVNNTIDNIISEYFKNPIEITQESFFSAKLALLDTVGCIFEASSHKEVVDFALMNFENSNLTNPFKTINNYKNFQTTAWYLTTLTRWFDYNDTFLAKEWAHPSDNFGAIYSYFNLNDECKFDDFIRSLIQAYEIQGALSLGTSLNLKGFDHVFYVKLASGSVFTSLLNKGDENIIKRTINNILQDGPTLRSYRHIPNVGKRKSWAAADASKRAVELSKISQFEDETYSGIQNNTKWGFEQNFLAGEQLEFGKPLNDWVINNVLFKVLYPAEFHGQSAIEAATHLHNEFIINKNKIENIQITTHEPAVRIIANKKELNNPSDRDHSLEYMVSAALLCGNLTYDMYFDNFKFFDQIESLRSKILVQESDEFTKNYYDFSKRDISNSIQLNYIDGTSSNKITIINPIGHPSRRKEALPFLQKKFIKNMDNFITEEKSRKLWDDVMSLSIDSSFNDFKNLLLKHE
ncbi:MAG: MmgE/PrpD family protein [Actinomycetota bacterium]|nr:MmgE/PrpD family protein [Actinomycetota bacterium]